MTEMPKSQELTAPGPPAETAPAIVPGFRSNGSSPVIDRSRDGVADHTADTGRPRAPSSFPTSSSSRCGGAAG